MSARNNFNKRIDEINNDKNYSSDLATKLNAKLNSAPLYAESESQGFKNKFWIIPIAALASIILLPLALKQNTQQKLVAAKNKMLKQRKNKMMKVRQQPTRVNHFHNVARMIPVSLIK